MKDSIIQNSKTWDWKTQTVGEGENKIPIGTILSRLERGYYKTKKVDIDLQVYNLRTDSFNCENLFMFLTHVHLTQKANLKYPVIVNNEGQVIDGRHRICKAIMKGKKKLHGIMIMDDDVI